MRAASDVTTVLWVDSNSVDNVIFGAPQFSARLSNQGVNTTFVPSIT